MNIIAIDPGISIGVAIKTKNTYLTLVLKSPIDLYQVIDKYEPDVLIFENFQAGGLISSAGQATLRLIGAIEYIAYKRKAQTCLFFPNERTSFISPARQMIKQTKRVPIVHEIDALAHLLLYEHRVSNNTLDKIMQRRRGYKT